jgi:hypothetical protein
MPARLGGPGLHVFAVDCFRELSAVWLAPSSPGLNLGLHPTVPRSVHQFVHRSEDIGLSNVGVRTRQTCATVSWQWDGTGRLATSLKVSLSSVSKARP